ncbi:MAG: hypothetical protein HOH66_08245 [Rhodospirillaceae bacterium]|jgi:hypothetical protein|nr:hypothetical protein [Rhodospirillaceae bacterium]MBT6117845.1 hypothetical protein [Rhodospirillaceae bacterium]
MNDHSNATGYEFAEAEALLGEAPDRAPSPVRKTVGTAGSIGCVCGTAGTVSTAGTAGRGIDRDD